MQGFRAAVRLLPGTIRDAAERMPEGDKNRCEEFRLRRGMRPTALAAGYERPIMQREVTEDDILAVTEAATRSSLHAAAGQLARGYLSASGGVRVGVCGSAAGEDGLRAISSLAIRVPRAVTGCADTIWKGVTEGGFSSLLIVSPPGAGKTTLLRELSRRLSNGGARVCIADERGEVADAAGGAPGFDVGPHTDVMTGISKAQAAMMMLRAMNPEILAMDEITDEEDAAALAAAVGCGVRLLATVHGAGIQEIGARPAFGRLLGCDAFSRYVIVENNRGRRTYRVGTFP